MYRIKDEEEIKRDMLDRVSNTLDKSQNSFIHDALAPAALELANAYMYLKYIQDKLNVENLEGEELETYVYQRSGITRRPATKARAIVKIQGEEGTIISRGDVVAAGNIRFIVLEGKEIGPEGFVEIEVECEEPGAIGNVPAGAIKYFPVSIPGLTSVTNLEPVVNGYDAESDKELRERYYERIRTPATSGNKYHYLNWAKEVTGVGDARVIPLWDGPGTVKVVIIDSNKEPASQALIDEVSKHIEEERPVGADVTVTSAQAKNINIELTIIKDEMFTLEQVRAKVEKNINNYFKETAFKVNFISYARIGKTILETEGVLDHSNLIVNGNIENIPLEYEEVPILGEVVLNE
ncbi:MAG TPA: baseplate J/gp47 family protein [Defluviitaleaceae bacterium]|nr:baseplate J/gp47 family protein [Defluviitaleaceae bacterium]